MSVGWQKNPGIVVTVLVTTTGHQPRLLGTEAPMIYGIDFLDVTEMPTRAWLHACQ